MTDNERQARNRLCLDFTNTVAWRTSDHPQERLANYADLVIWSQHANVVTEQEAHHLLEQAAHHPALASAVLEQAITLRESIYRIFSAVTGRRTPKTDDITTLNSFLSEAMARPRLALTEEGFTWSWTGDGNSLEQVLWPVARSAAELLTSSELDRVGMCPGDGCGWLFFDTSKNRSRRWCSMGDCGNRAKARRHYQRKRVLREGGQ